MPETQEKTEITSIPKGQWIYPFEKIGTDQLEAPGDNSIEYNIEGTNLSMQVILEDIPPNVEFLQNRNLRRKALVIEISAQNGQEEKRRCYLKDVLGNTYKGIAETVDNHLMFRKWLREFSDTPTKPKPEQFTRTVGTFKRVAISFQ